MRPVLLALCLFCGGSAFAGVKAPVPAPVRLAGLAKIDGVRIDYGDKSVVIRDAAWLARFRKTLAEASLLPAEYCFCSNVPTYTLLAGDDTLGNFEVPHGRKLRISGSMLRGEFSIAKDTGTELGNLAQEVSAQAKSHKAPTKPPADFAKPPRPPDKVDVKL